MSYSLHEGDRAASANGYLTKPFDTDHCLGTAGIILARRRDAA
jgi:hypothetical protein